MRDETRKEAPNSKMTFLRKLLRLNGEQHEGGDEETGHKQDNMTEDINKMSDVFLGWISGG